MEISLCTEVVFEEIQPEESNDDGERTNAIEEKWKTKSKSGTYEGDEVALSRETQLEELG